MGAGEPAEGPLEGRAEAIPPRAMRFEGLTPNADLELQGSEVRGRLTWLAKAARRLDLSASEWLPVHRRVARDGGLFREHREYEPGDELRNVDWNVFARRRELVTKLYEPDERGRYGVLIDLSGSVVAAGRERWKTVQLLGAGLATVALNQGNTVVLAGFGGTRAVRVHQHEHPSELHAFLRELDELPRGGAGKLTEIAEALAGSGQRPGAWIVVGDLHPREDIEAFLRRLGGRPALMVHPVAERDMRPLGRGLRRIGDPEAGRRRWVLVTPSVARRYAELVRGHRRELRRLAAIHGAGYFEVDCAAPFDRSLLSILRRIVAGQRRR